MPYGDNAAGNPNALRLESSTAGGAKANLLFEAEFKAKIWHNFAVQVDFDNKYVPF
jgi:hypothetical protein